MGAEIGNSTQKLHARGPIGMRELCTTSTSSRATARSGREPRAARASSAGRSTRRTSATSSWPRRPTSSSGWTGSLLVPGRRPAAQGGRGRPRPRGAAASCASSRWPATAASACRALEVDRGGPSFTVDTLRALHARAPEDDLTFIVGGDMAHSLPSWREPEAVLELATLAVAEREGVRREDIARRLEPLHAGGRVTFFDMPRLDLSSSAIRASRARGAVDPLPRARRGGPRGDRARPVPARGGEARRMSLTPERLRRGRRRAGPGQEGGGRRRPRPARRGRLHGLVRHLASGGSDRQAKAIHDGIHEGLKKQHGLLPRRVEGLREARWILMDYLDVVVHVFTPEARGFYRLEQLWGDVPAPILRRQRSDRHRRRVLAHVPASRLRALVATTALVLLPALGARSRRPPRAPRPCPRGSSA